MTLRLLNLAPALSPQHWALARGSRVLGLIFSGLVLSACAIGPDYQRPQTASQVQYKEAAGWSQANPSDSLARGAWWELYGDQQLNALVERLNSANQSIAQSEAQYRQAQALVRSARGAFYPSADLSVGKTRSSQGTGSSSSSLSSSSSGIRDTYNAQLGVSWEADIWGKLRRGLEANEASAEASLADLAAMRLSQQSELVQNYLQLRVIDEQKLHHAFLGVHRFFAFCANNHAGRHRRGTRRQRLGSLFHIDQTHAAIGRNRQFFVIAKVRHIAASFFSGIHQHTAFGHFNFYAINL